jgi:Uma2 family endonuclease
MSSQPLSNWFSLDEYFALERASDRRFEYRNGEIVCMSGGSREHAAIARNIVRCLSNKLSSTCQAYGSDLAVYVPGGLPYRYSDASVVCGEARFRSVSGLDALENPVIIVEVLSPTSADFDRGTKFEQYKSISGFAEYVLVAQDHVHLARRTRRENGSWTETVFKSLDGTAQLETLGVELLLREVYQDVVVE